MAKVTADFIRRNLLPALSNDYLVELHDMCCTTVTAFGEQNIKRPIPEAEKNEWESFRRALAKALQECINYQMFGLEKQRNALNIKLMLLMICSADEAVLDLREYSETLGIQLKHTFSNSMEFTLAHLLEGNIKLLKQVKEMADIKKGKSYIILPPHQEMLNFAIQDKKAQEKARKQCEKYLQGIIKNKGIPPVCNIQYDKLGNDYWFTISRGHYTETRAIVDASKQEIEDINETPANRDIVIYRGDNKCLYINLEVNAALKWLLTNYAIAVGRILFGFDIWEMTNRYTMDVFKHKSFQEIEDIAKLVPGLRKVTLCRLNLVKPLSSKNKKAKELGIIGYKGTYKSVTEAVDIHGQPATIPPGFIVERALMLFEFEKGSAKPVSLTPEKNGLELDNEQFILIDRFFELAGFDRLYNRINNGS